MQINIVLHKYDIKFTLTMLQLGLHLMDDTKRQSPAYFFSFPVRSRRETHVVTMCLAAVYCFKLNKSADDNVSAGVS